MYYRAKGEYHDYFTGYTTAINELITERERNTRFRHLSDKCFKKVECRKRDTYICFGCRYPFTDAEVVEL